MRLTASSPACGRFPATSPPRRTSVATSPTACSAPNPAFWLPTGSGFRQVIDPLVKAIKALGVNIVTNTEITGVSCADKRVTEIGLRGTTL